MTKTARNTQFRRAPALEAACEELLELTQERQELRRRLASVEATIERILIRATPLVEQRPTQSYQFGSWRLAFADPKGRVPWKALALRYAPAGAIRAAQVDAASGERKLQFTL